LRSEPAWLPLEIIVETNADLVLSTGEPFVADRGKLEGALNRPLNLWLYNKEDDLVVLAVELLVAIGQAHAFLQGNKRTAWVAMNMFLRANGYVLELPDGTALGRMIEKVITREFSREKFAAIIRPRVLPAG
jgi:death-on-curing protein